MTRSIWVATALAGLLLACASQTPELDKVTRRASAFDSTAGEVEVTVLGDGFVRCADRRLPLEAVVLELRQRTRAMTKDDLLKLVVQLRSDPQAPGSAGAAEARRGMERLVQELQVMGVRQIRYL